jgi:hypothetical protein
MGADQAAEPPDAFHLSDLPRRGPIPTLGAIDQGPWRER